MNGQRFYYQPPRTLSLPDPFLYHDYSYLAREYWDPYCQDVLTDEDLETPTSDKEDIDSMNEYVEYGDDYIDAGPTSFPSNEYYPAKEEMLHAQDKVETVCPLDLLRSLPVTSGDVQMDLNAFKEDEFPEQDTILNPSFDFDGIMQLDSVFPEFMATYPIFTRPLPSQVSCNSEDAIYELKDGVETSNQVADLLSTPAFSQDFLKFIELGDLSDEKHDAWVSGRDA